MFQSSPMQHQSFQTLETNPIIRLLSRSLMQAGREPDAIVSL